MTPSGNPDLVALAKGLRRQKPKGGRMSLLAISAELAAQGFLNENGRAFAAASVKSMLGGPLFSDGHHIFCVRRLIQSHRRGQEDCMTMTSYFPMADALTSREREITSLVSVGLSNKEIAQHLNRSEGTVKIHLHNIFRKLRLSNRTALAAMLFNRSRR